MGGMSKPRSFSDIVDLWPTRDALASEVGASHEAVRKWAQRDFIAAEWWPSLLKTSRAKSAGVTADLLVRLTEARV